MAEKKVHLVIDEIAGEVNIPIGEIISKNHTLVILEEDAKRDCPKLQVSGYFLDESGAIQRKNFNKRKVFPLDDFMEKLLVAYGVRLRDKKRELLEKLKLFLKKQQ